MNILRHCMCKLQAAHPQRFCSSRPKDSVRGLDARVHAHRSKRRKRFEQALADLEPCKVSCRAMLSYVQVVIGKF